MDRQIEVGDGVTFGARVAVTDILQCDFHRMVEMGLGGFSTAVTEHIRVFQHGTEITDLIAVTGQHAELIGGIQNPCGESGNGRKVQHKVRCENLALQY